MQARMGTSCCISPRLLTLAVVPALKTVCVCVYMHVYVCVCAWRKIALHVRTRVFLQCTCTYIGPRGGIFPPPFRVCMLHIHVHTCKLIKRVTSMIFQSNPASLKGLEHAFQLIFPLVGKFLEKSCIYTSIVHCRHISQYSLPTSNPHP